MRRTQGFIHELCYCRTVDSHCTCLTKPSRLSFTATVDHPCLIVLPRLIAVDLSSGRHTELGVGRFFIVVGVGGPDCWSLRSWSLVVGRGHGQIWGGRFWSWDSSMEILMENADALTNNTQPILVVSTMRKWEMVQA